MIDINKNTYNLISNRIKYLVNHANKLLDNDNRGTSILAVKNILNQITETIDDPEYLIIMEKYKQNTK